MTISKTVTRIGTAENLPNGSTHDILLVSVSDAFPSGQVSFKFEDTPRKITGIQKVSQLFMKVLFTQKGSDVINFNMGTEFPELTVGANRTLDDPDFLSAVSEAVKDAENQVKSITASLTKDFESQLASVTILSMNIDKESLAMYLQVTTRAGQTATIAVPFPELDMKLANG